MDEKSSVVVESDEADVLRQQQQASPTPVRLQNKRL